LSPRGIVIDERENESSRTETMCVVAAKALAAIPAVNAATAAMMAIVFPSMEVSPR
jgi:hypothetical protein